jgi:hypothetical protein
VGRGCRQYRRSVIRDAEFGRLQVAGFVDEI